MIDLEKVPGTLFTTLLESNLLKVARQGKAVRHFLQAVRSRLGGDVAWLEPLEAESRLHLTRQHDGDESLIDGAPVAAFGRGERPTIPRTVLLSPLRVHGRKVGVLGVARRVDFEYGQGHRLNRLARVLAEDLARRDDHRLDKVLDRIRDKVIGELHPRDLAYQILDGLQQLVSYDHSGTLFLYDAASGTLRIAAEKVAWTKAKSAFIGHEVRISREQAELVRDAPQVLASPQRDAEMPSALEKLLGKLVAYHHGHALPEVTSTLFATLRFGGELLGLLKLAAYRREPFDERDREVVERFLPAARVSLRTVRLKETLEQKAVQAEVKAGLVTVARAVAHDANNAVAAILLRAEQAEEEARADAISRDTLIEDLGEIIDRAALCKRIFSNMVKVGHGRSGTGPVNVNRVIEDLRPMLEARTAAEGVELVVDLAQAVPPVRSSRSHLEHILWNLVSNSVDALAGSPGRIVLRSQVIAGGKMVVLTVEDDGPGIEPELLSKIEEPFFSTKGSTGLGLAICRSLAWQDGGRLEISSKPAQGTTVEVRFPATATDEMVETGSTGNGASVDREAP